MRKRERKRERAKRHAESWRSSGAHVFPQKPRCCRRDIREDVRVGTSRCEDVPDTLLLPNLDSLLAKALNFMEEEVTIFLLWNTFSLILSFFPCCEIQEGSQLI